MSSADAATERDRKGWLFGPAVDLLIGCGLAYVLSVPLLSLFGAFTGATKWPTAVTIALVLFVNSPHYGATIVRVYETREDRRKYVFFTVFVTIALALVLLGSSWNVWVASMLITVYLSWSPWHYSGQNYGLMLMFLRRRGIDVDATTKRFVYASFILSAAVAILAIHGGNSGVVYAPQTLNVANTPTILYLPIPTALSDSILRMTAAAYVFCLAAAAWRLRGRGRARDFGPAAVLVLNQALWTAVPALTFNWGAARTETLFFAAIWLSAAHSAQYLWVTAYYARSSGPGSSVPGFLGKAFVAGTAVTILPAALLAPGLLGHIPFDAGLAACVFSTVNLHHFILDGAIWKLRDGRVARVLLRTTEPGALPEPIDAPRRPAFLRKVVWGIAALSVAIPVMEFAALRTMNRSNEPDRIDFANRILQWTGRERIRTHVGVGERLSAAGNHAAAIEHYRRSIELFPTGRAWGALGVEYVALGDWEGALAAFDSALELNPEFVGAHFRRAEALLANASPGTEAAAREQAMTSLERALELQPNFTKASFALARIQTQSGRADEAVLTLERALAVSRPADAALIRRQLEEFRPPDGSASPLD